MKPTDLTHLRATVARLAEAREQLRAWAEIEKEEKALILDALTQGVGVVSGIPAVAVNNQTRRGLDSERLRTEQPEIYSEYLKETHYKIVRVLS